MDWADVEMRNNLKKRENHAVLDVDLEAQLSVTNLLI